MILFPLLTYSTIKKLIQDEPVNPDELVIITTYLTGTYGRSINLELLANEENVTWSIIAGTLPDDLALNSNQILGQLIDDLKISNPEVDNLIVATYGRDLSPVTFDAKGREPHTWSITGTLPEGVVRTNNVFSGNLTYFEVPPLGLPITSGLLMWIDTADTTKFYDSVSGGNTTPSGEFVLRAEDKSGLGNHLTHSVSSECPIYQSSTVSNRPGLNMNGGVGRLLSSLALNKPYTIVMFSYETLSNSFRRMVSANPGNSLLTPSNQGNLPLFVNGQGFDRYYIVKPVNTPVFSSASCPSVGSAYLSIDAVKVPLLGTIPVGNWGTLGIGNVQYGQGAIGYLHELIVYDRELSESEIYTLYDYIRTKWHYNIDSYINLYNWTGWNAAQQIVISENSWESTAAGGVKYDYGLVNGAGYTVNINISKTDYVLYYGNMSTSHVVIPGLTAGNGVKTFIGASNRPALYIRNSTAGVSVVNWFSIYGTSYINLTDGSWTRLATTQQTIDTSTSFTSTAAGGVWRNYELTVGVEYRLTIGCSNVDFAVINGITGTHTTIKTGDGTTTFTATRPEIYIRNGAARTLTINKFILTRSDMEHL